MHVESLFRRREDIQSQGNRSARPEHGHAFGKQAVGLGFGEHQRRRPLGRQTHQLPQADFDLIFVDRPQISDVDQPAAPAGR
jgi:hypothetical protein